MERFCDNKNLFFENVRQKINLIIYGEPYSEYGSESTISSDKPKYNIEWLVNDKPIDDIFVSGTKKQYFDKIYIVSMIFGLNLMSSNDFCKKKGTFFTLKYI